MTPRSLGLWAWLALAADAFLLPPGMSTDDVHSGAFEALDADPQSQLIKVECAGCLIARPTLGDPDAFVWQEADNSLILNFTVGEDPSTLELNGVRFYPPSLLPLPLFTTQFEEGEDLDEFLALSDSLKTHVQISSYEFHFGQAQTIGESGDELIPIALSIRALSGQPVNVDLGIAAYKAADGSLTLAGVGPSADLPPGDMSPTEHAQADEAKDECTFSEWFCRWRAAFAEKVDEFKGKIQKGCHGRPHHSSPTASQEDESDMSHHGHGRPHHRPGPHHQSRPQHGSHHGPHHGHHGHHGARKVLRTILGVFFTIFIPILIGVAAGMATYLVGVLIGCAIASLYVRFHRGGRHGQYESVAQDEEESPVRDSEKQVYIVEEIDAEGEAPPQYEETIKKDESRE
ncbi:hypothetical protein BDY21DRAFT_374498 [Lineolata rhizophorae]|uniref:Uncharacterized protein n=1 Tax=Lineolata rhizophorae TaxID=578093 RepID=A0A6A6NQK3_9PEZI|nr:hypothetical protein BDY21DRAFT_374498 [Lineolata rhizophorae]